MRDTVKTIGVAMATYNGEKYITEQLESILGQTVRPDFIVVSDGMSNDSTVAAARTALKESGIEFQILTSDSRLSVTENFQRVLIACDTDYIFISDQDDVWREKKIERMLQVAENMEAGLVFSNSELVDSNLKSLNSTMWDTIGYSQKEETRVFESQDAAFVNTLLKDNIATGMCMCISRELKERAMPLSKHGLHDVWLTLVSSLYFRTVALNENLVLYRQHGTNAVGGIGGIKTSLKNKQYFVKRLIDREKLTSELIDRMMTGVENAGISAMLEQYDMFLRNRVAYVSKEKGFSSAELLNGNFGKFSRKPVLTFVKDVYARTLLYE